MEKLTNVEFTNLDKILYPRLRITKAQVIEYYIKIAPRMLDQVADRPVVRTRFPNGADKEGFYEKDAPSGTPGWVKTFKTYSETARRELSYVLCNNLDTLIWLANLAALELHMTLSKTDSYETPDLVLFDLDPKTPASFDDVVDAATLIREELERLGLKSYAKTSGIKGLHVIVPIVKGYTFKQTREFVQNVGRKAAKQSEMLVTERSKSDTPGRIYIDYVQNSHGRTMVCPYSLRATPTASVSTPVEWSEVKKGLNPEELNLFKVSKTQSSPWKGLFDNKQKLEIG